MIKKSFQQTKEKVYTGKHKLQTIKNQEKKTQLFLKTISFDTQEEKKPDIQFNTSQNFQQTNQNTSLNSTQKEFTSLPNRTKNKTKYEEERNHSESNKMYKTATEWKEDDQFNQNLDLMVGQLSCNQIETHRQTSQMKTKNCTLQCDYYKVTDPCFQIFDELKKYKGEVQKEQRLQQFSNIYSLLFEEEEKEICDIQYVSHQIDILDKNRIIPVIHEEYQDFDQEIIQNISQFCSNNHSMVNEEQQSAQSERKQPLAPNFRVKKKQQTERSQESQQQSFNSDSKINHFEMFDQEFSRIQNNLDKNKEIMSKKINIKTQHLKKLHK